MKKSTYILKFLVLPLLIIFSLITLWFLVNLHNTTSYYRSHESISGISIREFPYPYKAAFAITSDIDATRSLREFLVIQDFLNTKDKTPLGKGLGLDIGASFFPIMKGYDFALVSPNMASRRVIIDLIKLGNIDFIHSFGGATTRNEIKRLVKILVEKGCHINVWINHSSVPSNIGPLYPGDNPGSKTYHTDFSVEKLGYHFIWNDDVTSILGQGRPVNMFSFFDSLDERHIVVSLYNNVFKEMVKYVLAVVGNSPRLGWRKNNELVTATHLDDGTPIFAFVRSNFCYKGAWGTSATASGLAESLRSDILEKLIKVHGYTIIYTHLGKNSGFPYLPKQTVDGLRLLEREYRDGNIYVTTSSKLLTYYVNKRYIEWDVINKGVDKYIRIKDINDPVRGKFIPDVDDLRGITFYTDSPGRTFLVISDKEIKQIKRNGEDETGRKSIMIPLKPLQGIEKKMQEYKRMGYFAPVNLN